jgi:phosphonate transport system substrate-binding protein
MAAIAGGLLSGSAALAQDKTELTLAVIRTEEMSTLAKRWDIAIKYLKEAHNFDINFYATTSYASVVEAMLGGFVDVGKLGPKIYTVAREKSGGTIVPLVSTARPAHNFNPNPCACYHGRLIAKAGGKFTSIEAAKGAVLSLTDPGSTSGNALPRALFPKEIGGKSLEEYFGKIFYAGSHTASIKAVHTGKSDVAFLAESTLSRVVDSGYLKKEDVITLWKSPAIPIDVIAINTKYTSKDLAQKIKDAFYGMRETEEGRKALKLTTYAEFPPAEDSVFDALRLVLAEKARLKKLAKQKKK